MFAEPTCWADLTSKHTPRQIMELNLANADRTQIYSLLCGLIAPRPIAWITSMNTARQLDAAPFSAFNYMGMEPPIVAVGIANEPGPGADCKTDGSKYSQHG